MVSLHHLRTNQRHKERLTCGMPIYSTGRISSNSRLSMSMRGLHPLTNAFINESLLVLVVGRGVSSLPYRSYSSISMSLRKRKRLFRTLYPVLKACLPNTEQYIFQNTIPDIEFGMDLRSDTKHHSVSFISLTLVYFSGLESPRSVRMKVLHVERYHLPSKIIHNVKWGEIGNEKRKRRSNPKEELSFDFPWSSSRTKA